jgi:hypothetical protein
MAHGSVLPPAPAAGPRETLAPAAARSMLESPGVLAPLTHAAGAKSRINLRRRAGRRR